MIRHELSIVAALLELTQHQVRGRRKHIAHCRERLKPSQCKRPGAVRHDLGDQGHADGKLPSHAQAGQEAVEREVPKPYENAAQPRERRVAEDGQQHRLGAADLVAHDPEKEARRGPSRS